MDILSLVGFKEITAVINDKVAIQKDNEVWVVHSQYKEVDIPLEDYNFQENDIPAKIKLLGNNKIQILEFHDLFQFNCTSCNDKVIELLVQGLKVNGYDTAFVEKYLNDPASVKETVIFNQKIIQHPDFYQNRKHKAEVEFEFTFKGKQINGNGTYIKYMFFHDIETMPETIDELFLLTVDLNKLIGEACHQAKDTWFMACSPWVKKLYL
jgi:hypothetical protein